MTLSLIALAVATTLLGIAVHIVWWRLQRPVDDTRALTIVVGWVPLGFSVASTLAFSSPGRPPVLSAGYFLLLGALAVLHGLFALVYMSCYTAAQAASPTVLIVLAASAPEGVTRAQLESRLTDDLVCGDLVQAAIDEKFVELKEGRLHIGRLGRGLLSMGRLVRKLAGLAAPRG